VRRGCLKPTGAFEDISIVECGQPFAQEWRITERSHETAAELTFGLPGRSRFERRIRRFRSYGNADAPDDALDEWYSPPGDAQAPDAQTDQCERHQRLRGHFTTNGDLEAMGNSHIDDALDQG
jgi:hypothetical protein